MLVDELKRGTADVTAHAKDEGFTQEEVVDMIAEVVLETSWTRENLALVIGSLLVGMSDDVHD